MVTGVTLTGSQTVSGAATVAQALDSPLHTAMISVKQLWEDPFVPDPQLELVQMTRSVGSKEIGRCEFRRHYGLVKGPDEASLAQRSPIDRTNWWVQVDMVTPFGPTTAWVGQVGSVAREVHPSAADQSGIQTWVALEPLQLLRKNHVHKSHWLVPIDSGEPPLMEERILGWLPPMNRRDSDNTLVGNMSGVKSNGTFLYGGKNRWSRFDMLGYLVSRFMDESAFGGPRWEIGSGAEVLLDFDDTINFGASKTVAEMLELLINPTIGLDFKIDPIPQTPTIGFEINVFALSGSAISFGGLTLPLNPNRLRIPSSTLKEMISTRVVSTQDQQYDRINVIGGRIVCCCTLKGPNDLVPKWTAALQTLYGQPGAAADDGEERDKKRENELFDPVYQFFGVPDQWNHLNGQAVAPLINDDGLGIGFAANSTPNQNVVRETLPWLPLFEGFDYMQRPAVNMNPPHFSPDLMPPQAWFFHPTEERYVPATYIDGNVSMLGNEWGIIVEVQPNHKIALGHFASETADGSDPVFDYDTMVATIAFETDTRLVLRHELSSVANPVGRTLNIQMPDAEFWFAVDQTVVGVDPATGALQELSGPLVLRNDTSGMRMVMAGAIARYGLERNRAEIIFRGFWPWGLSLGWIMDVIETGATTQVVDGPMTQVEWIGGPEPQTIIRAGYAL